MEGKIEEAYDLLSNPMDFPRWWRGPELRVEELEPKDESGLHQLVRFEIKGTLPYTLKWKLKSTELNRPNRFKVEATGDLAGSGTWTFQQDGPWVDLLFDWKISVQKPLLRCCSFLLRPLFIWNHHWVMKTLENNLRSKLESLTGS